MNGRPLTEVQISRALRAHLPDRAQAGLRDRILEAAEGTTQQRALPSFLAALTEADPVVRRRNLLVAAALLIALALATAAAVGGLRLLESDPIEDLSLEPPTDVAAFVLSSYDRMPELPPVAMTWVDSEGAKGRIYVHQSGAVRFDRYASTDSTEPTTSTILRKNHLSGLTIVGADKVWVEQQDEAFGDDARVFIHSEIGSGSISFGAPGCETTGETDQAGNRPDATGWRYVGGEYVAGRPAYHFACGGDLWLDIETRLILRARARLSDDAGQPIPGAFRTIEVTEIAFGDQPLSLFEPPEGVARMPIEAYNEYLCTQEPVSRHEVIGWAQEDCSEPTPPEAARPPEATPLPFATPTASVLPGPGGPAGPLAWTEASLDEDWPGPVRPEPIGGAIVRPLDGPHPDDTYSDPSGDIGSGEHPWADIREVQGRVVIDLVSNLPPLVPPTDQWIAYGVVVDDDRDGIPDRRFGIDNISTTAPGEQEHRAWVTDLHSRRTVSAVGPPYGVVGETFFDTFYPGEWEGIGARLGFGGDTTGPPEVDALRGLRSPFYAWAAVIVNGHVVATDYAPDVGWLDPSR